ncbi:MAG: exodeoxyribonuclease V subunit alpha [Candidatus Azotimanducaceae bacterium]|uniref:RecBCD enzyme subunit RecD n=1 Tax=OM182 bacterium TaxID=2510334 RepID=A0A520RYS6_9GAMM|nr:exodeoxyribonuclease V subunit alpha [Gammaproteobacteria bacterium]RZO75345.1 MAG: exodeoxyribonuclease V subunit alpha [OM182 bacterium]
MSLMDLRHIDHYFKDFISRIAPDSSEQLLKVMSKLSKAISENNSCIELSDGTAGNEIIEELKSLKLSGPAGAPISVQGRKIYLSRYFHYEQFIAERLISFNRESLVFDRDQIRSAINQDFNSSHEPDWQKIATLQALTRQLTIITGGPGTGKTRTIAAITGILQTALKHSLRIELAAPTGKAAIRLSQAITEHKGTNTDVKTIHRLLGISRDGSRFKYNDNYRLPCDVVIIDEASMIGLTLMYRLLSALPDACRLILVGDPDQLPSVEVGNVLADLCKQQTGYNNSFRDCVKQILGIDLSFNKTSNPLDNSICRLRTGHRFSPHVGIGSLANHIKERNPSLPQTNSSTSIHPTSDLLHGDKNTLLVAEFKDYLEHLKNGETDPRILAETFEEYRLLTPVRDAPLGVEDINQTLERELESLGLKTSLDTFYHGRPILITRNDYTQNLYNGDVGICVSINDLKELLVAFVDKPGKTRLIPTSRLPPHETCFAMTAHKAQGSEFTRVTLILPADPSENTRALLSQELIYTAITRARATVKIFCSASIWKHCMENRGTRVSGLSDFFTHNV